MPCRRAGKRVEAYWFSAQSASVSEDVSTISSGGRLAIAAVDNTDPRGERAVAGEEAAS
jgi:hypothetical protein